MYRVLLSIEMECFLIQFNIEVKFYGIRIFVMSSIKTGHNAILHTALAYRQHPFNEHLTVNEKVRRASFSPFTTCQTNIYTYLIMRDFHFKMDNKTNK